VNYDLVARTMFQRGMRRCAKVTSQQEISDNMSLLVVTQPDIASKAKNKFS
jgi:hypothetical protein